MENTIINNIMKEFGALETDIRTNCGELSDVTVNGLINMFKAYTDKIVSIIELSTTDAEEVNN